VEGLAPVVPSATRSDHEIAVDFMSDMRGAPPSRDEAALLFRAVDACCEDVDVDTVVA
jgi:exonuclease SbcD